MTLYPSVQDIGTGRFIDQYSLHSRDGGQFLSTPDLGCTIEDYERAIFESLTCGQPEGHVMCGQVRVYAVPFRGGSCST